MGLGTLGVVCTCCCVDDGSMLCCRPFQACTNELASHMCLCYDSCGFVVDLNWLVLDFCVFISAVHCICSCAEHQASLHSPQQPHNGKWKRQTQKSQGIQAGMGTTLQLMMNCIFDHTSTTTITFHHQLQGQGAAKTERKTLKNQDKATRRAERATQVCRSTTRLWLLVGAAMRNAQSVCTYISYISVMY